LNTRAHEAPSVLKMSRFEVTSPTGVPDVTFVRVRVRVRVKVRVRVRVRARARVRVRVRVKVRVRGARCHLR